MTDSTIEDQRLCGEPSPWTEGSSCIKRLRLGEEPGDHAGGHMFADEGGRKVLESGHYDATALLSGLPASWHEPEKCTPECPKWKGPR